jgi:hypothetical protein
MSTTIREALAGSRCCKSSAFSLGEHEFSKIPTIPVEIRTSPFPICSLLTVVSRGRSIGRNTFNTGG